MFSSSFKLEKQILDPEIKSKKRAADLLGPSLRYFDEVIQISDAILKNRLNLRKKRLQKLRNEVVLILTTESEERIALEKIQNNKASIQKSIHLRQWDAFRSWFNV